MIEGISGVIGRISEINSRIDEIKSLGKNSSVQPLQKNTEKEKPEGKLAGEQSFSQVLQQVLQENNALPGQDSDLTGTDVSRINHVVGTKNDSQQLLELLYKKVKSDKTASGSIPEIIQAAASQFKVDPALIKAVIQQESGYDKNSTSNKGAMGLMQLMPQTADLLGVENAYDPGENIMGGTKYLKMMLNRYDNDLDKALAAYNAGPNAVDKFNGVPPYDETQDYVKQVIKNYNEYKKFE